jgi:cytochrome c553
MRSAAIAAATCWLVALPCVALADRVAGEKKADLCLLCHGVEGKYFVPVLDGQPPAYFIGQISAYKTGKRTDAAMNVNAASLSAVMYRTSPISLRAESQDAIRISILKGQARE